jgi:hypothetical protein
LAICNPLRPALGQQRCCDVSAPLLLLLLLLLLPQLVSGLAWLVSAAVAQRLPDPVPVQHHASPSPLHTHTRACLLVHAD